MSTARSICRWSFTLGALFVVGPIASRLTDTLHAPDGSIHTSLLVTSAPAMGLAVTLAVFALTALLAVPAGGLFGPRFALRIAAFCLAWASWTTGTIDEIIRSLHDRSPVATLALEGALVGILSLALLLAILRTSKIQDFGPDGRDLRAGPGSAAALLRALASPAGLVTLAASLVGAALLAWVFAIEPLKGQAIFGAFMAAIGAGAAGHLAAMAMGADERPEMSFIPFLAPALLGVLGPISLSAMLDSSATLREAAYAGQLFPLGHILPLDWVAGSFLGIPIGLAWVKSMSEEGTPQPAGAGEPERA